MPRINAKHGVVLLVIIVVAISCVVYLYVEDIKNKTSEQESKILFSILDCKLDENDQLNIKMGFINDHKKQNGTLRIEMEMLIFENRVVTDKIPMFMKSISIIIDEGETIQELNNLTNVYDATHSLKVTLMVNNEKVDTKFLVICEKNDE